jgi:hypothetical protein
LSKKIKFFSKDSFVYTSITPYVPSKKYIPDWYKDSKSWINGDKFKLDHNKVPEKDIKLCIPFLDSLYSGYTLELWCDVYVKQEENGPIITWFDQSFPPVSMRNPEVAKLLPTPLGCHSNQFTWSMPWGIKTPLGYSLIASHPHNRFDLPFVTLTGIVDAESGIAGGNHPVFFSNTFEGLIPAGTPIVQILPFKRENWASELINDSNLYRDMQWRVSKVLHGAYKKTMWHKKKFD